MRVNILTIGVATALAISSTMAVSHDGHNKDSTSLRQAESIAAAVASPDRPEAARNLDESRKPSETLTFLGLELGMDAADILPGNGYWSEIMAHAVKPEGSVTALRAVNFGTSERNFQIWKAVEGRAPGISQAFYQFEHFSYEPESFDFAITNLNFHDLYVVSEPFNISLTDPDEFTRELYAAMRPGGIVGVIDHVGPEGDTETEIRAIVEATHRIAPSVVIADMERAGFEFVGQSDLLSNPEDDHTRSVFSPDIRGKTDRFLLKFRRPAN